MGGWSLLFFSDPFDNLSTAKYICEAVGGRVYEPRDLDEYIDTVDKAYNLGVERFWLGITDELSEGV